MAGKNIKGITIEIGGNTTKLGKALEDSEKKSRSLQTELREIQNSLKFNPGNIEILNQKQTVLTQSIAETSDQLDILKEAEKQVIAQFERGEVAEDQVRALQREIIKTENKLESMTTELKSTTNELKDLSENAKKAKKELSPEEIQEATDAYEDLGDKAKEAGEKIGAGIAVVGTAIGAGVGYALTLSSEFDKAFNTMQMQTGATAEEMEELNEIMEKVYSDNFGESIEDVAQSMSIVKTQTKLTGTELENTTKNALLMRDVFGFEVNESIRGVNSMMNQFGISADEAYTLIAQGAQSGLNQNGDLMDVINEYSVHFQRAGYSAEDMFNMLANGVETGTWSVDKLGDAVKEFNIRMSDGSAKDAVEALGFSWDAVSEAWSEGGDEAKDVFNMLINEMDGLENTTEGYNAGVGLLGTMFEDLGYDAVLALSQTEGQISKTSDALKNINDQKYDDIGSAIQGLGRTLQVDLIDPLGDEFKPVVEDAIEYVKANGPEIKETISNVVKSVGDFVKLVIDNKDAIIGAIVSIGAGFLAWKAVSIITAIIPIMTSLISVIKGGTVAFKALNLVMKANIIGVIITAITALVAGFIYLWNNCEGFRNFWIGLWEGITNAIGVAVDWISSAFDKVVGFFKENWQSILLFIMNPFAGAFKYLYENFEGFRNFVDGVISSVKEFFSGLWAKIVEIFTPAVEWFGSLFSSISDTISSVIAVIVGLVQGCWELIKAIFGIVYEWFDTTVITPVREAFSAVWSVISTLASDAWGKIQGVWTVVSGWFNKTIITPISNFFSKMWTKLKTGASDAWTGIKSVFSVVTTWFSTKFNEAWTAVKKVFSSGGKIFSGIKEGIASTFKTVVNGIIKGINKVVAVPFNTINGVLTTLRNASIAGISPFSSLPSLNVPEIPLLYRGGILRKGQVGLLEGNGAEAVVPLEKETAWITRIAQKMNDIQGASMGTDAIALSAKMDEVIRTMKGLKSTIVLDTGTLVGETINQIDTQLGNNYSLRERRV